MARPFLTENLAINNIKKYLKTIKDKTNITIEFLGFVNFWNGRTTKLKLRCTKHNIIWETTSYNNLHSLRNTGCPKCSEEKKANSNKYTPEEALQKVLEFHKDDNRNYDYSKILTTFKGVNKKVTITCPLHGDFEVLYSTLLLNSGNNRSEKGGYCPKCFKEFKQNRLTEKNVVIKITEKISEINKSFNTKLEFLGFADKYCNNNTKIILKCNIHNIIWNTTSVRTLLYSNRGAICPECSSGKNKISKTEQKCYLEVLNYIEKEKIHQQFRLYNVYDAYLNIYRTIYLDLFIPELNIAIEYDGEQHIRNILYYHKSYQDFINQVNRDRCLEQYCKENNIKLLRISYKDNNRIPEIIKIFFEEGKDITTKVEPKLLPVLYHG